jgi:Protein of unknown function (DUF2508).
MESVIAGVFEVALSKKTSTEDGTNLLSEIEAVRQRIETVASHFEMQTDPDLIEASIYESKSLAARYRYLFREARRLGLTNGKDNVLTRSERS